MISFFKESDRKNVLDLWRRTFNDNEGYINNFIDVFGKNIIVYRLDGVVVGMVTLLDISIGEHKGGYIYALAVDEEYQKQGIATRLLTYAQETMVGKECKFLILVPEPYDSLEVFYKKLGFDCELPLYTTVIHAKRFAEITNVTPVGEDKYYSFRKIQPNVVVHSKEFFKYVYEDLISDEFQFLKVQSDTFLGYCVCVVKGDYVIIKETIPVEYSDCLVNQVCEALNVKKAILISNKGEQRFPFALMKCFSSINNDVYANLLLDSFGG